jgi:hypothetical protein
VTYSPYWCPMLSKKQADYLVQDFYDEQHPQQLFGKKILENTRIWRSIGTVHASCQKQTTYSEQKYCT